MSRGSRNGGLIAKFIALAGWQKLFVLLGAGLSTALPLLIGFVMVAIIFNTAGNFYLGAFTGIHLTGDQQKWVNVDKSIQAEYQTAADHWKDGLDVTQQGIVKTFQLDLPTSVLLTLGKYVDNYTAPNQEQKAMQYYKLVGPKYTWVQGQGETIHKFWATRPVPHEPGKTERYIETQVTTFKVWELVHALVWDGTFTSTWKTVTIGSFTNGVGTETIEPTMVSGNMQYDWSVFYAAAKKYGFTQSDVDPLWFDAIFSMQYALYKNGDMSAWLRDPNVAQWGPMFGVVGPIAPPSSAPSSGYIPNAKQVESWVNQALQVDGLPSSWEPAVMTIISHESGGNPDAYNPIGINEQTGGPGDEHAEGIMQTLPPTFAEYAEPGHTDIWNPVDNLIAALKYIEGRYKSPFNINGIGNSQPYGGY